jgi:hypothetical protein
MKALVGVDSEPAAAVVVAGAVVVAAGFAALVLVVVPAPFVFVAGWLQADTKASIKMASMIQSRLRRRIFIFISYRIDFESLDTARALFTDASRARSTLVHLKIGAVYLIHAPLH